MVVGEAGPLSILLLLWSSKKFIEQLKRSPDEVCSLTVVDNLDNGHDLDTQHLVNCIQDTSGLSVSVTDSYSAVVTDATFEFVVSRERIVLSSENIQFTFSTTVTTKCFYKASTRSLSLLFSSF
jgi:hypothetical protein